MATLASYFDYRGRQSDGKIENPVRSIRRPRRQLRSPQPVEEDALQKLFERIDNLRDRALFGLAVSSGLRLSELYQLNKNTIQMKQLTRPDGTIMALGFGEVIGKGDKARTFLVDVETVRTIRQLLSERGDDGIEALFVSSDGQRLSRRGIQDRLHTWCKRLRLSRLHMHQFRHSFATRLANAGILSIVLKELMGHSSFSTTQVYFRIEHKRLAQEYHAAMELIGKPGGRQS